MVILVVLKIAVDLYLHKKSHRVKTKKKRKKKGRAAKEKMEISK
jgi:hypothetical protein